MGCDDRGDYWKKQLQREAADIAGRCCHRDTAVPLKLACQPCIQAALATERAAREKAEAERDEARKALANVTEGMDRAGGDGYGMPECPWCRRGCDDDGSHDGDCALVAARVVLSGETEEGRG